jgi:hypothetical protein
MLTKVNTQVMPVTGKNYVGCYKMLHRASDFNRWCVISQGMKNRHKTGNVKGMTNIYKILQTENFKGNTVRPGQRRENYIVIRLKPTV